MQQFPHLHALLDYAERMWLESLHTGDEQKDEAALNRYYMSMYAPTTPPAPVKSERRRGRKRVRQGPPPGWGTAKDVEAQFDAFAAIMSGSAPSR
ncbi:hypothetical protein PQB71_gp35 [Mycobacterium phage Taptic]|uniref:Uncharacterized protein n=1 Tax=Mycobacterium phage Taptic TaxID=1920305 RepID=A0A1J0MDU4_9CAUD|nr:hypothetical protein PQB71_gp35 [Mycobacterium phage Taptic]AVO21345.1 hypothetical protein PBI_MEGABEAR_35 [Mycobacterium phage Megabear]WRQ08219.1 hypothetical protein JDBV14_00525 [Mycobacterium phage harman]BBC28559.1 hypothetical protein [Mycobacterium phage D12]BBC28649.1 hypothetical protein [Mycobacterium phage PR]APD19265.1 hypothetical protein SEA_TAPTIC_35 [Mycobacterium phage Taptic]